MNIGFDSLKDILDVLIVPISLAVLALVWPWRQSRHRGRKFIELISRELSELQPDNFEPYPETLCAKWDYHQEKRFVHQIIFLEPSNNTDFILTLPPDLVYNLSQLWFACQERNLKRWQIYLRELSSPKCLEHLQGFPKVLTTWENFFSKHYMEDGRKRNLTLEPKKASAQTPPPERD